MPEPNTRGLKVRDHYTPGNHRDHNIPIFRSFPGLPSGLERSPVSCGTRQHSDSAQVRVQGGKPWAARANEHGLGQANALIAALGYAVPEEG